MVHFIEVKAGHFEAPSRALLDTDAGVEMARDSGLAGGKVRRIMGDEHAIDFDLFHDG